MNIKDFVAKDKDVQFVFYRARNMFYGVISTVDHELYTFPVPLDDIGDASLMRIEKSVTLMRYIRKAIEDKTLIKVSYT